MKNSRAIVMLLVAVALGALAVVLAARWLGQQGDLMTNKVVTAARDIQLGTELTPDMLTMSEWPIGSTPTGAFKNMAALQARVVKTSLQRGEPILENKLAPVGTKGGLSAVIAEGKRAITVKVNEVIGVAGFALPGSHVDIMVNTEDEQERMISKIVLERILVLAVAQEASRDDTKPKVVNAVTLEVTPEEAEKIDLARSIGNLSLVLRNQVDEEDTKTLGIRKGELLGETAPVYARPAATARRPAARPQPVVTALPADIQDNARVEVIKGLSRSEVEFQNP
jgi:pilus assembly protein CpaB